MTHIRRLAWLLLVAGATPAHAHSPVPGIEGFYVGLVHPFSTPSQALLMLGIALVTVRLEIGTLRWLLGCFLLANLAGLVLGPHVSEPDPFLFAAAFAACALAALAPGRLVFLATVLAGFGGYLIGEISIPDDGPMRDRLFTMSGSIVGANLGLLYLFGINSVIRERFTWPWVDVAYRVVAAWLGAVALLMLALGFAEVAPLA